MVVLRGALEAGVVLFFALTLGHGLEYLASHRRFGLHLVPLGPGSGVDVMLSTPSPFGEHGWVPVPLGVLDIALLWSAAGSWSSGSWWGGCVGAVWGQLPTLAVCAFGILPSLLAAWLLWMPRLCTPLPTALAATVAFLSLLSLLFWADALPILPRARATDTYTYAATRRAWLSLLHAVAFGYAAYTSDGSTACALCPTPSQPLVDPRVEPGACAALLANLSASPSEIFSQLSAEMSAQTPQGAMSPYQLVAQVLIATYAVHLVVDLPNGAGAFGGTVDGPLWGASD